MKALAILAAALLLGGCQGSGANGTAKAEDNVEAKPVLFEGDPATEEATTVALIRNDELVTVGSDPAKAFEIFRGNKPGGFLSEKLPPGFGGIYAARVWQGANEGFGVITWKGKVIAAMYQEEGVTQERLNNEIVPVYLNHFGENAAQILRSDRSTAWFWRDQVMTDDIVKGRQLTMVQAVLLGDGKLFVTTAMGDERVLEVLGVNPSTVLNEQAEADRLLKIAEAPDR